MRTVNQLSDSAINAARLGFTALLCAALLFFGYRSIHWQVVWDPSIMHYVNFLMDHGLAPYRDIVDINLPGSYFMDRFAMSIFGAGDLGWRIYEFCLLGMMTGALVLITLPYDWFAGFCAAALFILTHALEGTRNAGQREELMTVLILVGYVSLFTALRRRKPLPMLLFGLTLGLAASLKPTAALLVVLLPAMAAFALHRQGIRSRPYLGYALIGFAASLVPNVWFFWHYRNFHDFLLLSRQLVTYYANVGNDRASVLLHRLVGGRSLLFLASGGLLAYLNRLPDTWQRVERNMLAAGMLFGGISYLAQRKDFEHHLYTYFVFMLLLLTMEATRAWKVPGWKRAFGLALITVLILYRVRHFPAFLARNDQIKAQGLSLGSDLLRVDSKAALQHQVLCFDVVSSCYSALYHTDILPYSNLVADYMVYAPKGYPRVPGYREALWQDLQRSAPRVIVVTNMWLCSPFTYDKLNQWPAMLAYLNANYDEKATAKDSGLGGYRVYVRKPGIAADHPLLPSA